MHLNYISNNLLTKLSAQKKKNCNNCRSFQLKALKNFNYKSSSTFLVFIFTCSIASLFEYMIIK